MRLAVGEGARVVASFTASHLSVSLPRNGTRVPIVVDASFELADGTVNDLVGPSGSGKSTLLRACALLVKRDAGEVSVDGDPACSMAPMEWRRRVCLVPQKPSLADGTVRDNLLTPWKLKVRAGETPPSDATLLELLELARLADVGLDRDVSQLSGGQAARIALLRAFATRPRVALLDEVDAALDEETADAIGSMTSELASRGCSVLRVRHRPPDGRAAVVLELRDGRLSAKTAEGDGIAGPSAANEADATAEGASAATAEAARSAATAAPLSDTTSHAAVAAAIEERDR